MNQNMGTATFGAMVLSAKYQLLEIASFSLMSSRPYVKF